ncbi:oxidoreductase NAD-binding domain-containing protein 1 isoform 2-T2 [Vipera latastei]
MICITAFGLPILMKSANRILPCYSSYLCLRLAAIRYCTINGKMKSRRKSDHLERTANDFRHEMISKAKVCGISNESETVKRLRLAVTDKEFTFKAGQWVDFFIPGVPVVGGFSICSSPGMLEEEGVLELAVKRTTHPPAHWIHTQCALNSEVALRVGGNFFYDPQPEDLPANVVLIAGGVGINPLFSILLHIADLHRTQEKKGNSCKVGTAKLFYSAKNVHELLFRKQILGLTNAFPGKITCSFHITKQNSPICETFLPYIKEGRLSGSDLEKCISKNTLWQFRGCLLFIPGFAG